MVEDQDESGWVIRRSQNGIAVMKPRMIAKAGRYMSSELALNFYHIISTALDGEPRWQIDAPGRKPLFQENWIGLNAALNGDWGWSLPESEESSAVFLRVALMGFTGVTIEFKADRVAGTGPYRLLSVSAHASTEGHIPSSLSQAEELASKLNSAVELYGA